MRHALTMALQGFEGAMVVVSHDRHLLRTTTDDFYLVHGGGSSPSMGISTTTTSGSASRRKRPTPAGRWHCLRQLGGGAQGSEAP